jgi:hypothetical protein
MNAQDALQYVDPTDADCAADIAHESLLLLELVYREILKCPGAEVGRGTRQLLQRRVQRTAKALRLHFHEDGLTVEEKMYERDEAAIDKVLMGLARSPQDYRAGRNDGNAETC